MVSTAEVCDLCQAALSLEHQHLLEPASRKVDCVCDPCAILFSNQTGQYRRVPRRFQVLPELRMTNAQWNLLMIPIGIAFLFRSSTAKKIVALYPSPAGPVESALRFDSWNEVAPGNAVLEGFEDDVEALLVYRVGPVQEYYRVPIDECFKLVGLVRMNWKGLSGGTVVWEQIEGFLAGLKQRSR
jgi:hypothetical protein